MGISYRWLKRVEYQLRATEGRAQILLHRRLSSQVRTKEKRFQKRLNWVMTIMYWELGCTWPSFFFDIRSRDCTEKYKWIRESFEYMHIIILRYMILFELRKCKKKNYNNKYTYSIGAFVVIYIFFDLCIRVYDFNTHNNVLHKRRLYIL